MSPCNVGSRVPILSTLVEKSAEVHLAFFLNFHSSREWLKNDIGKNRSTIITTSRRKYIIIENTERRSSNDERLSVVRFLADSNCCKWFCRPVPNLSAKEPCCFCVAKIEVIFFFFLQMWRFSLQFLHAGLHPCFHHHDRRPIYSLGTHSDTTKIYPLSRERYGTRHKPQRPLL